MSFQARWENEQSNMQNCLKSALVWLWWPRWINCSSVPTWYQNTKLKRIWRRSYCVELQCERLGVKADNSLFVSKPGNQNLPQTDCHNLREPSEAKVKTVICIGSTYMIYWDHQDFFQGKEWSLAFIPNNGVLIQPQVGQNRAVELVYEVCRRKK